MKKVVLFIVMALVTVLVYGQDKKVQKFNDETNLIEVTDYHDNGIIIHGIIRFSIVFMAIR